MRNTSWLEESICGAITNSTISGTGMGREEHWERWVSAYLQGVAGRVFMVSGRKP